MRSSRPGRCGHGAGMVQAWCSLLLASAQQAGGCCPGSPGRRTSGDAVAVSLSPFLRASAVSSASGAVQVAFQTRVCRSGTDPVGGCGCGPSVSCWCRWPSPRSKPVPASCCNAAQNLSKQASCHCLARQTQQAVPCFLLGVVFGIVRCGFWGRLPRSMGGSGLNMA